MVEYATNHNIEFAEPKKIGKKGEKIKFGHHEFEQMNVDHNMNSPKTKKKKKSKRGRKGKQRKKG